MLQHLIDGAIQDAYDLRVVVLIKDVRAWAVSIKRLFRLQHRLVNLYVRHIYTWYRSNMALLRYAESADIPYFRVGYDYFCIHYPESEQELIAALGLSETGNGDHHIAYGNPLNKDQENIFFILYYYFF